MSDERTNLSYVVDQTLLWNQGITGLEYDLNAIRIIREVKDETPYYSFEVITNSIRPGKLKHPLALVMENVHISMVGSLSDDPNPLFDRFGDSDMVEIEIEDMPNLFLREDQSGCNNVAVQTKVRLQTASAGSETMTRHFIFKNNMLFRIQ